MLAEHFKLTLKWAKMLTPYVRHLACEREDGEKLDFIPGQFITIHFDCQGKALRRSYSIATIPNHGKLIEFAAAHVPEGAATELLFNLEPGEQISVTGPKGRLVLHDTEHPQRYILVATGTGVTPYRTMLPQLEQFIYEPGVEVVLLQGVQKRQDLLYADDFIHFAKRHPNFHFYACYSREQDPMLKPHEYRGYVQHLFGHIHPNPASDIVYLCGNPNMIDQSFNLLKDHGFETPQVRREKYISKK